MRLLLFTFLILLIVVSSYSCKQNVSYGDEPFILCKITTVNISGSYHLTEVEKDISDGTFEDYFADTDSCRADDKVTFGIDSLFHNDVSGLCNASYPAQTYWYVADDLHIYIGGVLYYVTIFDCKGLSLEGVQKINGRTVVTYMSLTKI